MADKKVLPELAAFIKKKLKSGYPQGELTNDLLKEGYSQDEINQALLATSSEVTEEGRFPLWLVFSAGLLVLGITLILVDITWLTRYKWYCFAIGIIGVGRWIVIQQEQKKG
ncbi:MAG TPA: hypothetical protein VF476_11590 [Chitinophagaceae bacterium]